MKDNNELDFLLNEVYEKTGYDFTDYAMASLKRRVMNVVKSEKFSTVNELAHKLSTDSSLMERFLSSMTVGVTSMFREPFFF